MAKSVRFQMPPKIHYQQQCEVSSMERLLGTIDLQRQPPIVQITIGATGGIFTGYLFGKTSKIAAALTGATLLVLQLVILNNLGTSQNHTNDIPLDSSRRAEYENVIYLYATMLDERNPTFCDCQGYIKINKKLLSEDLGQAKEQLMAVFSDTIRSDSMALEASPSNEWFAPTNNRPGLNKFLSERIIGGFLGGLLLGFGFS